MGGRNACLGCQELPQLFIPLLGNVRTIFSPFLIIVAIRKWKVEVRMLLGHSGLLNKKANLCKYLNSVFQLSITVKNGAHVAKLHLLRLF